MIFQPEQTPKRPTDEEDDEPPPPEKQPHENETRPKKQKLLPTAFETELTEEEKQEIFRYVENVEVANIDALDEASLKKMILLFEKRVLKNQEMRIKFPEDPGRFMESEVDLNDAIQELRSIAANPDLYPLFVELNAVPSLLELLAHQNTDISVAVVDVLQEMTDVDGLHESMEGAHVLIETLRKQQVFALLVQNLERLDETAKEEADGVHNTLAVIENLMEVRTEICREAAEQGLMLWILKRLKVKLPFDPNKLYCSEILSIMLQTTESNRLLLGSLDGIDVLLQQLAVYKRQDPATSEETEFMENLFNCLCSSLMARENRERFLRGEGLQLMILMLRERKLSRNGSLKVLDHAMAGPDGRDNCNKFVDVLGLRTIFPLFMKTPKRNKQRIISMEEHEEHVCSIIASMLRNSKGPQRQRLLPKFSENDFEKVERLLELHIRYLEKVEAVDIEIEETEKEMDLDESDEAYENYMKRLAGGLFILQLIDYIVLEISAASEAVKARVIQILNLRKSSMKTIRNVMREYAGNLGDAGDSEWRTQEVAHILQLVDRF